MKKNVRLFRPYLDQEDLDGIKDCFDMNWLGLGSKVNEFELQWSTRFNTNSLALNSATAALHLAIASFNFPKGKKVLVPSMTFSATAMAVIYNDLIPVFVDVEQVNLTICIEDLNKKIDRDCVAIIPVHYGGSACRMEEIMELAKKNNLKVIEDCAHTQGGLYKEKLLGTFGDIGCFSFEEKKGMTTGDGGMLCSNNKNIIDHLRPMRWVGIDKDTWRRAKDFETSKENSRHWFYEIRNLGFKYNMNNMAASLGISQLKKLDKINNSKNNSIHTYLNNLKGHKDYKLLMDYTTNFTGSYWLFGIRTSRRSELIEFLQTKGVSTGVHFTPLNEQPYFQNFPGETPRAKALYSDILTLPLYPVMEEGSVEYVCEMVNNFFI